MPTQISCAWRRIRCRRRSQQLEGRPDEAIDKAVLELARIAEEIIPRRAMTLAGVKGKVGTMRTTHAANGGTLLEAGEFT
jgi:hypothetical protein